MTVALPELVEEIEGCELDPTDPLAGDARRADIHIRAILDHPPHLEETRDDGLLVPSHDRLRGMQGKTECRVDGRQQSPTFAERRFELGICAATRLRETPHVADAVQGQFRISDRPDEVVEIDPALGQGLDEPDLQDVSRCMTPLRVGAKSARLGEALDVLGLDPGLGAEPVALSLRSGAPPDRVCVRSMRRILALLASSSGSRAKDVVPGQAVWSR